MATIKKNHKGTIGIIFLVVSLLIVSSSLIITVNKIQKDYNKNDAMELDNEFIQNDFSGLGSLSDKDFDSSSNSFFGGGGGGSSKKSSSSSSNNPNEDSQNINLLEGYEANLPEYLPRGEILSYGTLSPYNAFALGGPQSFNPCNNTFSTARAENWFDKMHYDTEAVGWPNKSQVQNHIQSNDTVLFYESAHGNSHYFTSGCNEFGAENTHAWEVELWIANYTKKAFTFLGSCDGMCNISKGTLSYAFRKGSNDDTVTVGYCGLGIENCSNCSSYLFSWENKFFEYLEGGYTVKQAFDIANSYYPACAIPNCTRFAGDSNLKLVSCEWGEYYCCEAGGSNWTCNNKTCTNLAGVSFMKSEIPREECGESYCENWGQNYCKNGNVYHKRTCYNAGCAEGACYNEPYEDDEIVKTCEYGCENAQCTYPDLVVENNPYYNGAAFVFRIRNIGNAIANPVYWIIDTNFSNEFLERTESVNLAPGELTWVIFPWTYSSSGNYNPTVIVDFDNLINESDEGNNEANIEVNV